MDTETLRFLDEREKKLIADIERAKHALDGIRRAKEAILANAPTGDSKGSGEKERRLSVPEMVRHSLAEQFPQGATVSQLFAFFNTRWGREISKPGLSVTLNHMKNAGKVQLDDQVWTLKRPRVRL
jgi:hypothetical protein